MKSRAVPMAQVLSEELRTPSYWRWLSEDSIVPACGVFIALLLGTAMDRGRQPSRQHLKKMLRD
jgi:hypothetical protein